MRKHLLSPFFSSVPPTLFFHAILTWSGTCGLRHRLHTLWQYILLFENCIQNSRYINNSLVNLPHCIFAPRLTLSNCGLETVLQKKKKIHKTRMIVFDKTISISLEWVRRTHPHTIPCLIRSSHTPHPIILHSRGHFQQNHFMLCRQKGCQRQTDKPQPPDAH